MKLLSRLLLCVALLFFAGAAEAQETDADGCKDSALISRFPGSIIHSCENKQYEQTDLPMADGNTKHVEGEYHYLDPGTREGTSEIQVFRNFQTALKNAGFALDFSLSPSQLVAHKGSTWIFIDNRGSYYYQTIVTEKEMLQEVTAEASSLENEIKKSGHVAIYGIHFASGKAVILPDSEGMMKEIVKLLQENPGQKLRVEGHTDNQGNASGNQALSEKRAQAVVGWLTSHGVAAARLTAKGFGQAKPIADNSTDEGQAKNRRVELANQE
jgi:OOP family OmpA-OmpF porin